MNQDPSAVQFVLIVIGIPIAIVAVVALLVLAPGWTRAGRYRPGDSWEHDPVLIGGGGSEPVPAIGGSSKPAQLTAGTSGVASGDENPGGISVRW